MTKHKTDDYKNSAVKYYLNNDKGDGYKRTCKIFDCKKSTFRDWVFLLDRQGIHRSVDEFAERRFNPQSQDSNANHRRI